jgi:hypothetical protein
MWNKLKHKIWCWAGIHIGSIKIGDAQEDGTSKLYHICNHCGYTEEVSHANISP